MARTMTAEALRARLERGEALTVLDIRDDEARAEWSIPGSLHVDASEGLAPLERLDLPAERPVVAVCYAGNSSLAAAALLERRGFDAYSLEGGMAAWSLAWNVAEVTPPGAATTILQVRRTGKGCLSYVVASRGEAAVVDPSLPVEVYLDLATARGWSIARVLETHVHADHLSRARALAERAWARLVLPETKRVSFARESAREGDEMRVGDASVRVLATPGHTAESVCYHVDGRFLLTGDTLFLDAVGRPDLEASRDEARMRAASLHGALARLLALPDDALVLPAHADEPVPFDGRPLAASLADVRAAVAPRLASREAFVEDVLARLPPAPPNSRRIVAFNEAGVLPESEAATLEAGANRCAVR
ncbi:MAG TPA: MBL fold metallo-hydrolase [Candidatus Thermoplasmatota archaeon]|nr:MBL fold metallo-hydrolase [Candidatus Thermoplasmatota archaeon]